MTATGSIPSRERIRGFTRVELALVFGIIVTYRLLYPLTGIRVAEYLLSPIQKVAHEAGRER